MRRGRVKILKIASYMTDRDEHNLDFYLSRDEPNKSCLLALRNMIIAVGKEITETVKYGMPCFCFDRKIFCYLWIDKKTTHPYILFADGQYIDHPRLEMGTRSRMKILRIDPSKDLPVKTIQKVLHLASKASRASSSRK
jgi:hypothetical protein